jgi:hypothetical protein
MNETKEKKAFDALHERCEEYVRCEDQRRLEVLEEIKHLLFQASLEDGYYNLLSNLDNQRHAYQDRVLVEVS